MKQILRSLFVAIAALLALPVLADDCVMHVTSRSGQTLDITFNKPFQGATWGGTQKYPDVTFFAFTGYVLYDPDGKPTTVNPDNGQTVGEILCEMPMENVEEITFTGLSGVNGIGADGLAIDIRDGVMRISGVTEPVKVSVASIDGILEYDARIESDTEINLNHFGSGMHVISAGGLTFKILSR